jgi:hypothetical protein
VIQSLNNAMNLLCFVLILFGGWLWMHQPEAGKAIVYIAGGAMGGNNVARAASRMTDPQTSQTSNAKENNP